MRADRSRLPEVGPDPDFTFPAIVRHTLGNGLPVRTIEHRTVPVITMVLLVDGGSGADPSELEGLAAISADMLDEGTGDLDAIGVSDALARIGADYDVEVAPDAIVLSLTTLTRFARRGASLLAALATRPSLPPDDFDRVRKFRVDRLRQLKDLPPAVADRAFLQLVYGDHPYAHLAIGRTASLQRISLDDVASFHAAVFRPSRATLVVAGAMSHAELLGVAEEGFGNWSPVAPDLMKPLIAATELEPPAAGPARLAVVPRPAATQSELRIGHLSAPRITPDYSGLLVMNAVLGGQFVSRINLKLREEKGYTYGARTGFDWRRGLSPFVLHASVHTAATADAIGDALLELEGIRGPRPPTDAELSLAKASLTRGYPRGFETAQQVARSVAQLALYGLPDSYFEEFVPQVNAVSASDVVRVAGQYIHPSRALALVVGDHAVIDEPLRQAGFADTEVLPVEE